MAPADAGDFRLDEDDDDFFGDFNPHPYQGGYNLAATFGTPLPPSSKICYPVSSSSAATAVPAVPSPPSPTPKPEDPRPKEPHGDEEARRDLTHQTPDVFPTGAAREGKARRRGRGFWKMCVRVLDYLFCYKDPYGERPIVVDSYVVPVCTIRKESEEEAFSVEVQVAPPPVGIVEAGEATGELVQTNDLSCHSNNRDKADTYSQLLSNSYYTPYLGKPDWFLNFSYSESHQAEEFQHEAALSYGIECKISDQPIHCYHHHCYIQSLDVQVEPQEPVSSEMLGYCEHFSSYHDQSDIHILYTPAHEHNIQSYTRTSDLPLEPFKTSYSHNWAFHDTNTQGNALENDKVESRAYLVSLPNLALLETRKDFLVLIGSHSKQGSLHIPNEASFLLTLIPNGNHSLISDEYGGIGSLFISPFYPGDTESYELPSGDEHASFEHNWHNLRYRNMPKDDFSLITQPAEDY